jgi:hypothetical protein
LNAWYSGCGACKTNARGKILEEYMVANGIQSCHANGKPTFSRLRGNAASIVDVTLANATGYNRIKRWEVSEEETLSDQKYITYYIDKIKRKKRYDEK